MPYAKLDKDGYLVGSAKRGKIECGDLPCDGTYQYRDGQFIPRGRGMGKPSNPPVAPYAALAMLIRSVGKDAPQECHDWADWYDKFGGAK